MLASGSKEAYWDALELDCASKVARHRHYGRRSSILWAVGIGTIAQAHGHSKSRETCGALLASGSKGAWRVGIHLSLTTLRISKVARHRHYGRGPSGLRKRCDVMVRSPGVDPKM